MSGSGLWPIGSQYCSQLCLCLHLISRASRENGAKTGRLLMPVCVTRAQTDNDLCDRVLGAILCIIKLK